MGGIVWAARILGRINAAVLLAGLWIGAALLGGMVAVILLQVFFRYVLGDALAWTEAAARFMMMWLTGLMAPTAFRTAGFVAIDMVQAMLPRAVAAVLQFLLLLLMLAVLVMAVRIGWSDLVGIAGRFQMAGLGVPRAWMMGGLFLGFVLLLSVCVELLLRSLVQLGGREGALPAIVPARGLGAE